MRYRTVKVVNTVIYVNFSETFQRGWSPARRTLHPLLRD